MKKYVGSLAVAFIAITPAFAMAQDAGKTQPETKPADTKADDAKAASTPVNIEPEAQKVLDAAKDAVKKVRDITYKVKQTGGMSMAGGSNTPMTGVVTLSIPEKAGRGMMPFDRYKFAINDEKGAAKVEWATDGKTLFKIDHAQKKLFSMATQAGDQSMPPQDIWDWMPLWLTEDRMQNPMLKTVTLTLGKDAEVGGVKCRVLTRIQEAEMPAMEEEGEAKKAPGKIVLTQIKYLGVQDSLPRKIEMSVKGVGMEDGPDMKLAAEMSDLKANAGLKDTDFALKAPEGFATEAGTYENMGLPDPSAEAPKLKAEVGKPALAFKLKDAKGTEVSLESLKGRVVLLDFWATWCGPCKAAMPSIQKLHEKFADKAVTVIGMNCWEQKDEAAVKYMEKQKYTYTLLLKADDLAKEYGISGIPTLILIGKDGNVLHTGVGFGDGEEEHLAEMIQKELDKK